MSFRSTSPDLPSVLHVSFANYGKKAQLGAQLVNCDSTAILKGDGDTLDKFMFTPGYAVVSKLIGGDLSVAKKSGVEKGDIIIAINGLGFRRFEQDYKDDQVTIIQTHGATKKSSASSSSTKGGGEKTKEGDDDEEDFHDAKNKDHSHDDEENYDDIETEEDMDVLMVNHRIVPSGNAYKELLSKIKSIKAAGGDPPLIITFERYGWDHRPNCWNRFLIARNNHVVNAMQLLQEHELWKRRMFPIDLVTRGMQKMIREKIISEIDVSDIVYDTNNNTNVSDDGEDDDENNVDVIKNKTEDTRNNSVIVKPTDCPVTVYVNYTKLMSLYQNEYLPMDEIISCFVIFMERSLGNVNGTNNKHYDVRLPKVNQFIDVTDCTYTGSTGFRIDILKQLYNTFEPNYPETLNKLIIYPVSTVFGITVRSLLSFVNEKTRKKFVITNDIKLVCSELGWNPIEVEECGSIQEYMYRHDKSGRILYYD